GGARGMRGACGPPGGPGAPRRDRRGGPLGVRAHVPDRSAGRPGRAGGTVHGEVRRQGRAQPTRVHRAGRAVDRGGLGERARPADPQLPPRARLAPALRLPGVAHALPARAARRPRHLPADHHRRPGRRVHPRRLVPVSVAVQPLGPPGGVAALRLVIGRPADRLADRRPGVRGTPRAGPGRPPRARAAVRAPDAALTLSLRRHVMPLSPKGFPVLLSFDIDAETMWTGRDPKNAERPIVISQGAYGWKVGMPRILDLLARYGLRGTFFVPGLVMEQRPAMVEAILKAGHEIAHHSWSHAWIVNLTLEEEREEMDKGIDI